MTPPTPPKTHNCDVLFEGWHWCIYLNKYMKDRPSDLPNRRGVAKIKVSDLCSNYWEPIPLLHILPYFIENICIDKHIFSLTSLLPVTTNTISTKSSWGNFQLWAQNIKQGKSKAKLQRVKKILGQEWHWSSWWSLWSSRIPVSLLIGSLLWLSWFQVFNCQKNHKCHKSLGSLCLCVSLKMFFAFVFSSVQNRSIVPCLFGLLTLTITASKTQKKSSDPRY